MHTHRESKQLRFSDRLTSSNGIGLLKIQHLLGLLSAVVLTACFGKQTDSSDTQTKDTNAGNTPTGDTSSESEEAPTTFTKTDLAGLWHLTILYADYQACFDESGVIETSEYQYLPKNFTVKESGALSGEYVRSGGSGVTVWTGTYTYEGQLSYDGPTLTVEGVQKYTRSGTTGSSTSSDPFSGEKIAATCGSSANADSETDVGSEGEEPTDLDTDTTTDTGEDLETDTPGVDTDTSPHNLEEAAKATAQVRCTRHEECLPGDLALTLGTLENCVAAAERKYIWEAAMPGTGWTIEQFAACMEATESLSCAERNSRATAVPACTPKGTKPAGDPCLADSQCDTGFCDSANLDCGTCAAMPKEGEECLSHGQCAPGQRCVNSKCTVPQGSLASCTTWDECDYGFSCVDGICRSEIDNMEEPCGLPIGNPNCTEEGLVCTASSYTCIQMEIALQGEQCGHLETGVWTACHNYTACTEGKCGPKLEEGEECCEDHTGGSLPLCEWPDECIEGKCKALPVYSQTCAE